MIGIAEHDLCFHLSNPFSCDSLNGGSSPNWHKNRGLNNSMRSNESARTSISVSIFNAEFKHRIHHYSLLILHEKRHGVFSTPLLLRTYKLFPAYQHEQYDRYDGRSLHESQAHHS